MKLSDLKRFALDSEVHGHTGGMTVTITKLGDDKTDAGSQRSLDMISVVAEGKDQNDAVKKGIDYGLEKLEKLQDKADIVKFGVLNLSQSINSKGKQEGFSCMVQVGLFDKADEGADLIKKKSLGFGQGKTLKEAQDNALDSALELMGEK